MIRVMIWLTAEKLIEVEEPEIELSLNPNRWLKKKKTVILGTAQAIEFNKQGSVPGEGGCKIKIREDIAYVGNFGLSSFSKNNFFT